MQHTDEHCYAGQRPAVLPPLARMRSLAILAAALLLVACSGGQKVEDKPPTNPADLDAPTAEMLAESPCGNPDWSELPEGSDLPESSEPPAAGDTDAQ